MHALLLAAALGLIPVHGVVLATQPNGIAIVKTDAAPAMLPAATRRYRLDPAVALAGGTGVDGMLDRSTDPPTLHDPVIATPFTPGLPDPGKIVPVDVGSRLPAAALVDQLGKRVELRDAFAGKTLLLSFVFTRCPDRTLCPAISGKYAYLQAHLDPSRFALAEITLDPPYDSPEILRKYGDTYGARLPAWSLLTGTGSAIAHLLNEFGISSLRVSSSNFIHGDKLFIVAPNGKVTYVVDTGGWDPQAVQAEAQAVAGLGGNPFERFKLSLIASVVALCGGSQFAGVVLLELALFFLIILIVAAALWGVARVLWAKPR